MRTSCLFLSRKEKRPPPHISKNSWLGFGAKSPKATATGERWKEKSPPISQRPPRRIFHKRLLTSFPKLAHFSPQPIEIQVNY